jgi:glycosyltransferase involved in cell wall biosynthesis
MQPMNAPIAIILPRREKFARNQFGAVALTVESYLRHSANRPYTRVMGLAVDEPRDAMCFRAVMPKYAWWRRKTLAYAMGCATLLEVEPALHIDAHQRIEIFEYLSRRFPDAAVSLWLHNDPQEMKAGRSVRRRRRILESAARVICVSSWIRGRFLEGLEGHPDRERAVVFPNPIEMKADISNGREQFILYVGRLRSEKGPHILARALLHVLPRLPEWRALFVGEGGGRGESYVAQLHDTVAPLGERVAFAGFLPNENIRELFARAAIAVVPSLWEEPFGRTALEALAGGCALVATLRGGLPEVVGDAAVPLIPETAERLATVLYELASSETLRRSLSGLGRKQAGLFEAKAWAGKLDALRREVEAEKMSKELVE